MSGRCPTSGLVCLRGERQGAGAWAAPGPLHPLPRLGTRYCAGAPGQGRHDAFGVRRQSGELNGGRRALEKSWGSLRDEEQENGKPWNGGSMEGMTTLPKRRAQYTGRQPVGGKDRSAQGPDSPYAWSNSYWILGRCEILQALCVL